MSKEFSFEKGYGQVQGRHLKPVKKEIMKALGIATNNGWYHRLYGDITPLVPEAKAIEAIFAKHGITEVWGGKESENKAS